MNIQISSELGKITNSEIADIPNAIRNCINDKKNRKKIKEVAKKMVESGRASIYCLGSGTSYHAGLISTYNFSQLARIPTHCELAPEFPYLVEPIVKEKHIVICISQSGESELTVYSAQKSLEAGAFVIAITNEEESSLAKIAGENTILTNAGEEKSVLATKTFVTQLVVLTALSLEVAILRKTISKEKYEKLTDEMKSMASLMELAMPNYRKEIRKIAPYFKFAKYCFVIGAGPDYANCLEVALKLKEGARIFAQAFSTAEFPHGPITLADPSTSWVLCMVPRPETKNRHEDVLKLIKRLRDRNVTVLGIKDPRESNQYLDIAIDVPTCSEELYPIFSIIPVQLLVVEIAIIQNINPDTPKFLTKVSGL